MPTPFVVDVPRGPFLDCPYGKPRGNAVQVEGRQGQITATAEQILGEIREYCRATQTAESTFGRLVVNDGKLVSRLRDGARITTGTLDKVRAYLSEHRAAAAPAQDRRLQTVKPVNGAVAPEIAPAGFR